MNNSQERPDIAAAISRMATKFGAKKELKELHRELWENETVLHLTSGFYANGNGLLVATDRRLLFFFKGVIRTVSEDFVYDRISSIEYKGNLLLASITVYVSNQKAEIQNLDKNLAKQIVDDVRAIIHNPPTVGSTEPLGQVPQGSPADQLLKLKQLLDAGVLTQEEYEHKREPLMRLL